MAGKTLMWTVYKVETVKIWAGLSFDSTDNYVLSGNSVNAVNHTKRVHFICLCIVHHVTSSQIYTHYKDTAKRQTA